MVRPSRQDPIQPQHRLKASVLHDTLHPCRRFFRIERIVGHDRNLHPGHVENPLNVGVDGLLGEESARFAEVRVDPELGVLRIARIVSVTDGGRIVNEKLARSQLIGGTVGGIGMATLEETITDPGSGRVANATLGDYLVPVNADVPDIDAEFVGDPDPSTPIGVKGIGELGLVGVPAAIANGIYHATGRRIRSLPITISQLL